MIKDILHKVYKKAEEVGGEYNSSDLSGKL